MAFVLTGAKYKDECPVENMIPIYLIVLGSTCLFYICGSLYQSYKQRSEQEGQCSLKPLLCLMELVISAWLICGCVWIYRKYEPNYDDPESVDYCNKTLYLFGFWLTNSYLVINGLRLLLICGICICIASCEDVNIRLHAQWNGCKIYRYS